MTEQNIPQPTQPQPAYMADGQQPQQQATTASPMQVNDNATMEKNTWATGNMAKAIAGVFLVMSLLGIVISVQAISEIEALRKLTKSFVPSSRSRGSSSSSSLDSMFDSALSQVLSYVYIHIVVCALQTGMSIAGMVGVAKSQLGVYKAYHYGTIIFFATRILLLFLLGGWYMILAVMIHAGAVYPMWAFAGKWEKQVQAAKKAEVEMTV